ncbi:MAG TPA: 50S ribosomal protein L13 [Candidatus Paceibacterota bacterium]
MMKYTIDAQNKRLGRVASEAASLLMGKNKTNFVRNANPKDIVVTISNCSKIVLPRKKMRDTKYARYSGYPGGLRFLSMEQIAQKKGYSELFKIAVRGMLPGNKLRPDMLKRLIVTE